MVDQDHAPRCYLFQSVFVKYYEHVVLCVEVTNLTH